MERNNNNHSSARNGISLQLRSKEVSEVMGNIPRWIGSWGLFLLVFLFMVSLFLIFNIHCIQRISGKAVLKLPERTFQPPTANELIIKNIPANNHRLLQISVSPDDFTKIREQEEITLFLPGANKQSNRPNGLKLPIDKAAFSGNILQVPLDEPTLEKVLQLNSGLASKNMDCQLITETTVFNKVFDRLF